MNEPSRSLIFAIETGLFSALSLFNGQWLPATVVTAPPIELMLQA